MTIGGWVLLTVSLTAVYGLAIYCYAKVLNAPPAGD
jgi:hypothetical protein